jgi:hypothetical protein
MKNKAKINRLTLAFASLMLVAVILCGCDGGTMPNSQTEWIIDKVEHENKIFASYHCKTLDATDFNVNNTWFMDTIGKFDIGDTLCWAKK